MSRRPLIAVLFSFLVGILLAHSLTPWFVNGRLLLFLPAALLFAVAPFVPLRWKGPLVLGIFLLTGMIVDQGKHRPLQLTRLASDNPRVTIEGTLLETVQRRGAFAKFRLLTEAVSLNEQWLPVREPVLVTVYDRAPAFQPGQRTRFSAAIKPFKNFSNPEAYDYESAMAHRGYACAASVPDGRCMVPMGPGRLPFALTLVEHLRRPVRERFDRSLDPGDHALMSALVLGERYGLGDEIRESFNRSGTSHILAVSGLHIGLIAAMAFFLARAGLSFSYRLVLKTDIRKLAAAIACVPVVVYTALAGLQVSSQRAMIMVLAFLISVILGKERDVWSTLALAALVILALDPHALYSVSFHLSFGSVVAILWMTPGLLKRARALTEPGGNKDWPLGPPFRYLAGLVAVTVSVTIFLLPLMAFHFHRISLVTIPANLLILPIVGLWILPSALLSAAVASLYPEMAEMLLKVGSCGLHVATRLIDFFGGLSWSSVWTFIPSAHEILLFYGILFLLLHIRRFRWAKGACVLLLLVALADGGYWVIRSRLHRDLRITYLDVGQGNAALVELPRGKRMLIDGGGFSRAQFDVGEMVVAPHLWRNKILRVHYLVLSHPQADHMNGLRFIADAFDPEEFWYNGDRPEVQGFSDLMAVIDAKRVRKLSPQELWSPRELHGVRVETLSPVGSDRGPGCLSPRDSTNDRSLVLKMSFRGVSFLFPGDIERRGEECLMATVKESLKSDVLLSPHHGSRLSSSEDFLRLVDPDLTVISSGSSSPSGFPHSETLERLSRLGSRILRIDRSGAVRCTVGEDGLQVETCLEGRLRPLGQEDNGSGRLLRNKDREATAGRAGREGA